MQDQSEIKASSLLMESTQQNFMSEPVKLCGVFILGFLFCKILEWKNSQGSLKELKNLEQ
jgi:hypothetical protein